MKTNEENLSLENICDGAAIERFDIVLQDILNNILDVNTEADTVREIKLTVKIKPSPDREILSIAFQVVPKPAPLSPLFTNAFIDKDVKGNAEAHEFSTPVQQELPKNVTKIEEGKVKNES